MISDISKENVTVQSRNQGGRLLTSQKLSLGFWTHVTRFLFIVEWREADLQYGTDFFIFRRTIYKYASGYLG